MGVRERSHVSARKKKEKNVMESLQPKPPSWNIRTMAVLSFSAVVFGILAFMLFDGRIVTLCTEGRLTDRYSVVFDAGSTGSRMSIFHFRIRERDDLFGPNVKLVNEIFYAIEPGVSSYASRPYVASHTLEPMLNKAEELVPENFQSHTLLTVKATAGLRLLPRDKGDNIIKEMRYMFKKSPFYLPNPDKIMIMDSEEEGLFGWITVNFLLDLLWDKDQDNTAAAIDLGGGSVQITFEIPDSKSKLDLEEAKIHHWFKVKLLNAEFDVFTQSYLGSGLKSARLNILKSGVLNTQPEESSNNGQNVLYTYCLNHGVNATMTYQEVEYVVKGYTQSMSNLSPCLETVTAFMKNAPITQYPLLWQREVHLFSYFYDVAIWADMIRHEKSHMKLTSYSYLEAAFFHCDRENFNKEYPFLCLDLLYVYTLLDKTFGIPDDKEFHVEKKIVGREVSWSLGAALATLSPDFSYQSKHL